MLGRPSMMRQPDIVGIKLTGHRHPGITATDIVLALTDGEAVGDRATISNICPEYGATAAMLHIDSQTINYLLLTGRDPEQVRLVEAYAKTAGLWADDLRNAEYERVLEFDHSTVVRNMAGPSNPHRRLPTSALKERGIAVDLDKASAEEKQGLLPDGAVITRR